MDWRLMGFSVTAQLALIGKVEFSHSKVRGLFYVIIPDFATHKYFGTSDKHGKLPTATRWHLYRSPEV